MNDPLDQALRDQARPYRDGGIPPADGLDDAVQRGRTRRRTRHAVLAGTAVLVLVLVAFAGVLVPSDADDVLMVPATQPPSTAPATTTAPITTTIVTTLPSTTTTPPTTSTPMSATPTPTSTTIGAVPSPAIDASGIWGVAFGTPMDEAVARLSALGLGAPDSDQTEPAPCLTGSIRRVRWGVLEISSHLLPGNDGLGGIAYGWSEDDQTNTPARPPLMIGRYDLLGGPALPIGEVEDRVRSALPDRTGEVLSDGDSLFRVSRSDRRIVARFRSDSAGTSVVGVTVVDDLAATEGCD
jgi:hypothetical protein